MTIDSSGSEDTAKRAGRARLATVETGAEDEVKVFSGVIEAANLDPSIAETGGFIESSSFIQVSFALRSGRATFGAT